MTHILPGSLEFDNATQTMSAAVHSGDEEFSPKGLRFVRGALKDMKKTDTILSFLSRVYDNSEGCLVLGGFRMKNMPD